MPDYTKMYHVLFNAVTDAIGLLAQAQIDVEEIYLSSERPAAETERGEREEGGGE